jgi:hypothetical protein
LEILGGMGCAEAAQAEMNVAAMAQMALFIV